MSQRLTRKDIKRNELATAVERTVHYTESHVRTIVLAVGGVLLAVALAIGLSMYLRHRGRQAEEALAHAMKVYDAPVDATAPKPEDPKAPSFADETARRQRAKQLFEELRDDYGSSDSAGIAAVYLGQIAVAEGDLAKARELWTEYLDDDDDSLVAGQTRLNLIALDRQQGKGEEVVRELQAMVDEAEPPLPQDVVLYELAVTYEQLGRQQEATEAYQRIVSEHPQSPYRQAAQQKVTTPGAGQPLTIGGGGGLPAGLIPGS